MRNTMLAPVLQDKLRTHQLQPHCTPSMTPTYSSLEFHPQSVMPLTDSPSQLPEGDPSPNPTLLYSPPHPYCACIFTSSPLIV